MQTSWLWCCYRAGIEWYKSVENINPNIDTIQNITIMIKRSVSFWTKYGPIIKEGFTFKGGYTNVISSGDGDYLTKDTLWDFKVSSYELKSQHTLQLLVYYIMGLHSIHSEEFNSVKYLGIYNPRMNKIYIINTNSIPKNIIEDVSMNVIGY